MKNLLSSRLLVIAVVAVIGVLLLGQSMGIAGPRASAENSDPESTLASSAPPQIDWALAGLLLGGGVITLLRPRRRKVAPATVK